MAQLWKRKMCKVYLKSAEHTISIKNLHHILHEIPLK